MTNTPIKDVLMCLNISDPRIRNAWLLTLFAQISCLLWLLYFSWIAGLFTDQDASTSVATGTNQGSAGRSQYIDIFLALATGHALDATAIVFNFNRFIIQQFHYFVSLRMVMLAMLISVSLPPLLNYKTPMFLCSGAIIFAFSLIYTSFIFITDRLHTLFSGRRISTRHGSMSEFVKHRSMVDISWTRCFIAAIGNLWLYLFLVKVVSYNWYPLIPVIQIACEPIFHYFAGAEKTPRYNMLVAPLLHASNCFEWGFRQVIETPRLAVAPSTYLALILVSRLQLDLHLLTVFRHRKDLKWARQNILPSTQTLVGYLAAFLLTEHAGIPIATYIKPIVVIFMDIVGFLPHIIPSSYAIAFDQVKIIRS